MRGLRRATFPLIIVLAIASGAGVATFANANYPERIDDLRDRMTGKQEHPEPSTDTEPEAPASAPKTTTPEPTGIVATPDPSVPLPVEVADPEPAYSIPPPSEPYKRCMSLEVIAADVAQGYTLTANHVGSEVVCVLDGSPASQRKDAYDNCLSANGGSYDANGEPNAPYCREQTGYDVQDQVATKTTRIPDSRTSW